MEYVDILMPYCTFWISVLVTGSFIKRGISHRSHVLQLVATCGESQVYGSQEAETSAAPLT